MIWFISFDLLVKTKSFIYCVEWIMNSFVYDFVFSFKLYSFDFSFVLIYDQLRNMSNQIYLVVNKIKSEQSSKMIENDKRNEQSSKMIVNKRKEEIYL